MTSGRAGERIVVGVDGSTASRQALRWAARQAECTGADLRAVAVFTVPTAYSWITPVENLDWRGQRAAADLDKAVRETLGDTAAERVQRVVVESDEAHIARRLLDAASGADLVVVGCHGHLGSDEPHAGSVARHVTARARCPVVVVPATAELKAGAGV